MGTTGSTTTTLPLNKDVNPAEVKQGTSPHTDDTHLSETQHSNGTMNTPIKVDSQNPSITRADPMVKFMQIFGFGKPPVVAKEGMSSKDALGITSDVFILILFIAIAVVVGYIAYQKLYKKRSYEEIYNGLNKGDDGFTFQSLFDKEEGNQQEGSRLDKYTE